MGQSYDGVYFFGIVYDEDTEEGWPGATVEAFGDAEDFDHWLPAYLGVAEWWIDGEIAREWSEYQEELAARCMEVFGVSGFETSWIGDSEFSLNYIAPKGAALTEWRGDRVPAPDPVAVEVWRVACERLRAVLPGAGGPPGFYFGCSVG